MKRRRAVAIRRKCEQDAKRIRMRTVRGRSAGDLGIARYLLGRRLWLPNRAVLRRRVVRSTARTGAVRAASVLAAGVSSAPPQAPVRDKHADAAEQRAVVAAGRGIGDVAHVAERQAAVPKAVAANEDELFGATVRSRLRRQLVESRAKASACVVAAQPSADASVVTDALATGADDSAIQSRVRRGSVLKRRRVVEPVAAAAPSLVGASEHAAALLLLLLFFQHL